MSAHPQGEIESRACAGDRNAFDTLLLEHRGKLRAVIRRMIGHPEDTDDLVQESTLKAWQAIGSFRGEASFSTWLCAVGVRAAIDHLRRRKRWRAEAQVVYGNECGASESLRGEVMSVIADPAFVFEADEHIAYCFSCVARSLPPQEQAVLVLREVLGMTSREAADALGISDAIQRHRLSAAREAMQQRFEGLCSLVNKTGVCYQCKGLREATTDERRGAAIPSVASLDERIAVVARADIDAGASQAMHDLFWRRTRDIEDRGEVSEAPAADCGKD